MSNRLHILSQSTPRVFLVIIWINNLGRYFAAIHTATIIDKNITPHHWHSTYGRRSRSSRICSHICSRSGCRNGSRSCARKGFH